MEGYPKVKGRLAEMNYTQEKLAEELDLSVVSLNAKLNGKVDFKVGEAQKICKVLKIDKPNEYFFCS